MKLLQIGTLVVYIAAGSAQSLFIKKSSQDNGGKQPYEPVAVTFTVELTKLMLSLVMIFLVNNRDQCFKAKVQNLLSRWDVAKHFAVPAFFYCMFNALAFYNLRMVTPPTYRLLINLKVLFSGLMLQLLLGSKLTLRQWAGLVLLVCACGIEQVGSFDINTGVLAIVSICFQAFCSSFAGVYFQLLLQIKPTAAVAQQQELGLWEKNLFMYMWTLTINVIYLALFNSDVLANPGAALATFDAQVIPIILFMGVGGVCTSLMLRDMDVIIKEYANFAETMTVVIAAWLMLGTPLRLTLFLATMMVSVSLYLYNVPGAHGPPAPSSKAGVAYSQVPTSSASPVALEMDVMDDNDDGHEKGTV